MRATRLKRLASTPTARQRPAGAGRAAAACRQGRSSGAPGQQKRSAGWWRCHGCGWAAGVRRPGAASYSLTQRPASYNALIWARPAPARPLRSDARRLGPAARLLRWDCIRDMGILGGCCRGWPVRPSAMRG